MAKVKKTTREKTEEAARRVRGDDTRESIKEKIKDLTGGSQGDPR